MLSVLHPHTASRMSYYSINRKSLEIFEQTYLFLDMHYYYWLCKEATMMSRNSCDILTA